MQIFKIILPNVWNTFQTSGVYQDAAIDLRDGYIHLSTAQQLRKTVELHFAEQTRIFIAEFDSAELSQDLKWEPSRGGQMFPHLYAQLPLDKADSVIELSADENGQFAFPDRFP